MGSAALMNLGKYERYVLIVNDGRGKEGVSVRVRIRVKSSYYNYD